MSALTEKFRAVPAPLAGLSLGFSGLGRCAETAFPSDGVWQAAGALAGILLLVPVMVRWICCRGEFFSDIRHPVSGSVAPASAMSLMLVSAAAGTLHSGAGLCLWGLAVTLYLAMSAAFFVFQAGSFSSDSLMPTWFIPTVGIIVADITLPAEFPELLPFARGMLYFGMACFAVLLPLMLMRLFLRASLPDAVKPSLVILSAPASLSLAGYVTLSEAPDPFLCTLMLGAALLMTASVYLCLPGLLKLPFSPAVAAFGFPLAISASALFAAAGHAESIAGAAEHAEVLLVFGKIEFAAAFLAVFYAAAQYAGHFRDFLSEQR